MSSFPKLIPMMNFTNYHEMSNGHKFHKIDILYSCTCTNLVDLPYKSHSHLKIKRLSNEKGVFNICRSNGLKHFTKKFEAQLWKGSVPTFVEALGLKRHFTNTNGVLKTYFHTCIHTRYCMKNVVCEPHICFSTAGKRLVYFILQYIDCKKKSRGRYSQDQT